MKQLLKAPLQAKHESPYRLLTNESEQKVYTFNDQHYAKVNHTTKHLTLAKQCTVPVFSVSGTVCKMRSAAYSVEWEAHPNRTIDSWIRGFVDSRTRGFVDSQTRGFLDSWLGKSVDLWIRGFRETRESLKITQISVSLLNRPQSH